MRQRRNLEMLLLAMMPLAHAGALQAEGTTQLWTNFMLEWQKNERLLLVLDAEPKALLSGGSSWSAFGLTPTVEFAPHRRVDLVGELVLDYTNESEDPDVFEVSARAGARVYLVRGRLQLRDLFRIEVRNLFYDDDAKDTSWRSRNRIELRYALNRPRNADPGAFIAIADWEWFSPLDGDPAERFASRHRLRFGLGHRANARWRFDAIYIWQRSRNTFDEPFGSADHILDVRARMNF